jgi:hypothetical protein
MALRDAKHRRLKKIENDIRLLGLVSINARQVLSITDADGESVFEVIDDRSWTQPAHATIRLRINCKGSLLRKYRGQLSDKFSEMHGIEVLPSGSILRRSISFALDITNHFIYRLTRKP